MNYLIPLAEGQTKTTICIGGAPLDCTRVCDQTNGFFDNPACDPGDICGFEDPALCVEPTAGSCLEAAKRQCTPLSNVQTRRLGKGLGNGRDWLEKENIEEEDTARN